MNTRLRLMPVASLLLIAVTGCTDFISIRSSDGGDRVQENTSGATLSDEKITEEEIRSIKEGTDFPKYYDNAIIYDPNKMLLTYSSSNGCVDHPESVAVEGNNLKVTFSEPEPNQICTQSMTGPFTKVINLPNESVPKTYYKVTAIIDSRERDIPVVVNYSP